MANFTDNLQAKIITDASQPVNELGKLELAADDAKSKMIALGQTQGKNSKAFKEAKAAYEAAAQAAKDYASKLDIAELSQKQLRKLSKELRNELSQKLTLGTPEFDETNAKLAKVTHQLNKYREANRDAVKALQEHENVRKKQEGGIADLEAKIRAVANEMFELGVAQEKSALRKEYLDRIYELNKQLAKQRQALRGVNQELQEPPQLGSLIDLEMRLKEATEAAKRLGSAASSAVRKEALERVSELSRRYREAKDAIENARKEQEKPLQTGSIADLERRLKDAKEAYNELGSAADAATKERYAKRIQVLGEHLKQAKKELAASIPFWDRMNAKMKEVKEIALGNIIGELGVRAFDALTNFMAGTVEGAAKLSDSLTDIQKKSRSTAEEVQALNKAFQGFDSRTSMSDLRDIAVIGGSLGVPKEELEEFTKSVDKVAIALGDEMRGGAEEAAAALGPMKKLFRKTAELEYGEALAKIGSMVNEVGNNSKAKAPDVAEFVNRIGALGELAPTIDQTIGLGSALIDLGLSARIAGGGLTNILLVAGKESERFAAQMGMSTEAFEELLNTDPNAMLLKLAESFEGLTNTQLTKTLEHLKIGTQESIKTMGLLANQTDHVRKMQAIANEEFETGASLQNEFKLKNENFAAELAKAGKELKRMQMGLAQGLLPVFKFAIRAFMAFAEGLRETTAFVKENKVAIGLLAGAILALNPSLVLATANYLKLRAAKVIDTVTTNANSAAQLFQAKVLGQTALAQQLATANLARMTLAQRAATVAQYAFNVAMSLNPVGLVIAGILALGAALYLLYQKSETARNIMNGVWFVMKELWTVTVEYSQELGEKLSPAIEYVGKVFDKVKQIVLDGWKKIFASFDTALKAITNFTNKVRKVLGDTSVGKAVAKRLENDKRLYRKAVKFGDEIIDDAKKDGARFAKAFKKGFDSENKKATYDISAKVDFSTGSEGTKEARKQAEQTVKLYEQTLKDIQRLRKQDNSKALQKLEKDTADIANFYNKQYHLILNQTNITEKERANRITKMRELHAQELKNIQTRYAAESRKAQETELEDQLENFEKIITLAHAKERGKLDEQLAKIRLEYKEHYKRIQNMEGLSYEKREEMIGKLKDAELARIRQVKKAFEESEKKKGRTVNIGIDIDPNLSVNIASTSKKIEEQQAKYEEMLNSIRALRKDVASEGLSELEQELHKRSKKYQKYFDDIRNNTELSEAQRAKLLDKLWALQEDEGEAVQSRFLAEQQAAHEKAYKVMYNKMRAVTSKAHAKERGKLEEQVAKIKVKYEKLRQEVNDNTALKLEEKQALIEEYNNAELAEIRAAQKKIADLEEKASERGRKRAAKEAERRRKEREEAYRSLTDAVEGLREEAAKREMSEREKHFYEIEKKFAEHQYELTKLEGISAANRQALREELWELEKQALDQFDKEQAEKQKQNEAERFASLKDMLEESRQKELESELTALQNKASEITTKYEKLYAELNALETISAEEKEAIRKVIQEREKADWDAYAAEKKDLRRALANELLDIEKQADDEIFQYTATKEEAEKAKREADKQAELAEAEEQFHALLKRAHETGMSEAEITEVYAKMKKAIELKYAKETSKALGKITEERLAQTFTLMRSYSDIFSNLMQVLASDSEDMAEFQKAMTIFNLALNSAEAIGSVVAAAASTSITPIDMAIKIAAGTATVLANIAKAKQVISGSSAPKYEKGTYSIAGPTHTEGGIALVDSKTNRKVGEMEGRESIISSKSTSRFPNVVKALVAHGHGLPTPNLEVIERSIRDVKRYENGGYVGEAPRETTPETNVSSIAEPVNADLRPYLEQLVAQNNEVIYALRKGIQLSYGELERFQLNGKQAETLNRF